MKYSPSGIKILILICSLSLFGWGQTQAATSSSYEFGTVEVKPLGSGTFLKVGRSTVLGRFSMYNPSRKPLALQSLRLKQYGKGDLDTMLANLTLEAQGSALPATATLDDDFLTFSVENDGFIIGGGNRVIFLIRGEITYARTGDTLQLGFQYGEDLTLTDKSGYQLPTDAEGKKLASYTLNPGDIRITRSYLSTQDSYNRYALSRPRYTLRSFRRGRWSSSPGSSNTSTNRNSTSPTEILYTPPRLDAAPSDITTPHGTYNPGSKDVVFFSSYVSNNSNIDVDGLFLLVQNSSVAVDKDGNGTANEVDDFSRTFSDFRLFVNGNQEATSDGFDLSGGRIGISFLSPFTFPAPQSHVQVLGRVESEAQSGDKLKLSLEKSQSFINPTYTNSGDPVQ